MAAPMDVASEILSADDIAGTFDELLAQTPLGVADAAVPRLMELLERVAAVVGVHVEGDVDVPPDVAAAVDALTAAPPPLRREVSAALANVDLAIRRADALQLARKFALAAAAPTVQHPPIAALDAAAIRDLLRAPLHAHETPCTSAECAAASLPKAGERRLRACGIGDGPSAALCFICLVALTERAAIQEDAANPHYLFTSDTRPRPMVSIPVPINTYCVQVGVGGVRSDAVYQPSTALAPRLAGSILVFNRLDYQWADDRVDAHYFFGIASAASMLL